MGGFMSRIIKDPKEIFDEFVSNYKGIYGNDLVSIILYGSAAGKDYKPGRSDINFMVVLTEEGIRDPERSFALVKKWKKKNVATPLFLTANYIETSTDVYPIEYLNFQRKYVLVYGTDILKGLSFKKEDLRLQAEREIKGKFLILRNAYLESAGKKSALLAIIDRSLYTFMAIFNALLVLKDIESSEDKRSIITDTCRAFGLDHLIFMKLLNIRERRITPDEKELNRVFKDYLNEIEKLSKIVDKLGD
jgi:predicted nucleotidyltransferase